MAAVLRSGGLLAAGLCAAALAVALEQQSTKFLVAVPLALGALSLAAILADSRRLGDALVALLGLAIPFNLDLNLFYRAHVGGAPALTIGLADLAAWGLLAAWARKRGRGPGQRFQAPAALAWPTLLLILVGALSLVNAEDQVLVLFEMLRFGKLLVLALVVTNLRDDRQLRLLLCVLAVGALAQGALAVIQYRWGMALGLGILGEETLVQQQLGYVVSRATGTIGHPNILAYFFELLLPLLLALALAFPGRLIRTLGAIAFLAGLAGLAATLSRGAWLALPLPLAVVFASLRWRRLLRPGTWLALLSASLLAAGVLSPFYRTIERRLTQDDYRSAESRIPLNQAALSIIAQHPLLGVGLNNGSEVFRRYDTTGHARLLKERQVVHNLHLLVWMEVGTLGLAAFWAIFGGCFWVAWREFAHRTAGERAVLVGASAGLLAHLIHGLFDAGFKVSANVSMLVYVLLGLVGYVSSRPRAARAEGSPS